MQGTGTIVKYDPDKGVNYIVAEAPEAWMMEKRKVRDVSVFYHDNRVLTPKQRKKAFALCREIAEWQIDDPRIVRPFMIDYFCEINGDDIGYIDTFSLSPASPDAASMTLAKAFIDWLIAFSIEYGVPTKKPLLEYAEDVGKYLYACIINRTCCLCQTPEADLHHVDAVGMGMNRNEINHVGMRAMALCRRHHIEVHTKGQKTFEEEHHIFGVKLDEYAVKKLKLGKRT